MPDTIQIKLPDGSVKEFPRGSTALDVAKSISPRLADAALAAKSGPDLIDLTRPLESDTDLRILTEKDVESLPVFRHSSAHLMAAAVLELFPETKLGIGPRELGERNTPKFVEMLAALNVSYDDFVRTTEPRHFESVAEIWRPPAYSAIPSTSSWPFRRCTRSHPSSARSQPS